MGQALLDGKCYEVCPEGYYSLNQTHVPKNISKDQDVVEHRRTVLVCAQCISASVACPGPRSRLGVVTGAVVAGVFCLATVAGALVCLWRRFVRKTSTEYEVLRFHRPRASRVDVEELNGKHLLSSDSESSEDEVEIFPIVDADHGTKQDAT